MPTADRYRPDHRILLVTARSAEWAMHTLVWLEADGITTHVIEGWSR